MSDPEPGNARDDYPEPGNVLDDDDSPDDVNRIFGATPKGVLEHLARSLVDSPDSVLVEVEESRGGVMLRLHVAPDDMGKVIGRHGRVATALRTVVRAAGASDGVDARVDIVD